MNSELNLRDIAGFCPEEAVWKMMADVSEFLLEDNSGRTLSPGSIVVDGDSFLVEAGRQPDDEFLAPEQSKDEKPTAPQQVWQLGAIACFMATGHVAFGGHGGSYQREHPQVALPVLPKAFQTLTAVVQRCLHANPSERISLEELKSVAKKGLTICAQLQRCKVLPASRFVDTEKRQMEKWPEEMIEL